MPIFPNYYILTSRTDINEKFQIIISYLTDEEEKRLDDGESITITRGSLKAPIDSHNVYCYGEVDFSKDSKDLEQIAIFNFLSHLNFTGARIPSDYDYETHTCHSPIPFYRYTETWRPEVLTRYAHACINKPSKIVLFRHLI